MDLTSNALRVQVIVGETDKIGHTPRATAILDLLHREGAAGCTVTRGHAGFGADRRVHTATILDVSTDLPMIITWIDTPARVEQLLPRVLELAGSGLTTVEETRVMARGGRPLAGDESGT